MHLYQQRVVSEKEELDEKIGKLSDFLKSKMFDSLAAEEKDRLTQQLEAMGKYSSILGERISAFPPEKLTIIK